MTDREHERRLIRQPLSFDFPQSRSRPVAATRIGRHHQRARVGIQESTFLTPPPTNGSHGKGAGVEVRAHVHEALVAAQIMDPVRTGAWHVGVRNIVPIHRDRLLCLTPLLAARGGSGR